METNSFNITKRDGTQERFSLDKIMNAIIKAFNSQKEPIDLGKLSKILSLIDIHDGITVEEIQNQVEVALMKEGYYNVAKSFILYRQQHTEDRETMEKLHFLSDYVVAANAATGSKFDANANVEHKNIATLIGELPKSGFIRLNRRLLTDRIKQMYGKEMSDRYIDLLTHHFIYKNDETSLANYCASITMYPWLLGGTTSIGGNSTAPTNLKSYCGGFINMVFMVGKSPTRWSTSRCVRRPWTRSSPTASSRLSTRSTSPRVPATTRRCFGTWLTTTSPISRASSASSASPMAASPTGTASAGCRNVSCAGSTKSAPRPC